MGFGRCEQIQQELRFGSLEKLSIHPSIELSLGGLRLGIHLFAEKWNKKENYWHLNLSKKFGSVNKFVNKVEQHCGSFHLKLLQPFILDNLHCIYIVFALKQTKTYVICILSCYHRTWVTNEMHFKNMLDEKFEKI